MNRPVGATRLAELPGAVERVDDPHPVRAEPRRVVGALLGEHHVTGAAGGQLGGEEVVRQPVAGLAQHAGVAALGAQVQQPPARLAGQVAGEHMIVAGHPGSSSW